MIASSTITITVIIVYDRSDVTDYRCQSEAPHGPHDITRSWPGKYRCPGNLPSGPPPMPADCMVHGCTRLNARSVIEHKPTCAHYELHTPPARCNPATCGGGPQCTENVPATPPAAWLEAWMSGYLSGYGNGLEDGTDAGYEEYGTVLAEALSPIKKAAARGIDMMMARRAWENQRRAEHGMPALTGPLERGGDREPYPAGGGDPDA